MKYKAAFFVLSAPTPPGLLPITSATTAPRSITSWLNNIQPQDVAWSTTTMSDSDLDNHRHRRRHKRKEKLLSKLAQTWLLNQTGFNAAVLAWVIAVYIPIKLYAWTTIYWLRVNITNTVKLNANAALTTDLMIWTSKQPPNHLLRWPPTFEHLERKDQKHIGTMKGGKLRRHVNLCWLYNILLPRQAFHLIKDWGWDSNYGTVTLRYFEERVTV